MRSYSKREQLIFTEGSPFYPPSLTALAALAALADRKPKIILASHGYLYNFVYGSYSLK
jgi:hypothetical protein